jgi:GxxExxY protein
VELRNSGKLRNEELSEKVIGAAIEVHRTLGPGFLESFYEEALSLELTAQGITFERQLPVSIYYRNRDIGQHRLDLLIDKRLVVELKAVSEIDPIHFSIVRSYVKA